jgi:hypothetical protein
MGSMRVNRSPLAEKSTMGNPNYENVLCIIACLGEIHIDGFVEDCAHRQIIIDTAFSLKKLVCIR